MIEREPEDRRQVRSPHGRREFGKYKGKIWRLFLTDLEQIVTEVVGEALERQEVSFEGSCGSLQNSPVKLTHLDFCP